MEVAAVDHGYANRRVFQCFGAIEPTEATTDDDDVGLFVILHHHHPSSFHQSGPTVPKMISVMTDAKGRQVRLPYLKLPRNPEIQR